MKNEFLILAEKILADFKATFSDPELSKDYVYNKIPQLVREVETWTFSDAKTDIGLAAIKLVDMGVYKDEKLKDDIVHLSTLYRLMQKPAARK